MHFLRFYGRNPKLLRYPHPIVYAAAGAARGNGTGSRTPERSTEAARRRGTATAQRTGAWLAATDETECSTVSFLHAKKGLRPLLNLSSGTADSPTLTGPRKRYRLYEGWCVNNKLRESVRLVCRTSRHHLLLAIEHEQHEHHGMLDVERVAAQCLESWRGSVFCACGSG